MLWNVYRNMIFIILSHNAHFAITNTLVNGIVLIYINNDTTGSFTRSYSLFLSAVPSATSVLGAVAGGALMSRLRLSPSAAAKLLVGSTFVVLCGIATALVMGCPQVDMAGTWNSDHDR